jgi:hypothetical protein
VKLRDSLHVEEVIESDEEIPDHKVPKEDDEL